MNLYSVPSDYKRETIDEYFRLNQIYENDRINETYGQITIGNVLEAGRIYKDIPQIDINALKEYINYSSHKGIEFNYTLNGTCMSNREFSEEGVKEIKNFLYSLYMVGVRSLTIALPSIVEIVKSMDCEFILKASTLCQITNSNKAQSCKNLGFNRIVLDESIYRDFYNLKEIVNSFGQGVEVIVNTLCYKDCIYRSFHYNQMGHDSIKKTTKSISSYYNHQCMLKRCEKPGNILRLNWIRPEDIKYYNAVGINNFKIQGRNTVLKGDPIRVVESYLRRSFDGNLMDLLELYNPLNAFRTNLDNKKLEGYIAPFFEKKDFCKKNCLGCSYCDNFIKNIVNEVEIEKINELATKFYKDCDEFTNMVKSTDINGEISSNFLDIEFEF